MKKIKIYSLAGLLLGTTACSDFLDKVPETGVPEEEAMTDLTSANEVVIGVYSSFKNSALYSGSLTLGPDIQSDLVYAVKGYTNAYGEFYRWDAKSNDTRIESVYGGLYQIIARANFFMDHYEEVASTLTTQDDKKTLKKYKGDVLFARALAYSDLIRTYCEAYTSDEEAKKTPGVSLYLHYRKGTEDSSIEPRSSLYDSYQQVLSDLNEAEQVATREGANTQYITKGAIAALKARVYLYMRNWEQAVIYATQVIDKDDIYELANAYNTTLYDAASGNYMTEYQSMWKYDDSDEIIWRIQMSTSDRGGALGTVFLNFNGSAYYPDYVPANWLLDSYASADYRYPSFFYEITTGYSHGLSWPIVIKYLGNADIDGGVGKYYTNMPKVLRLSEVYLIRAEAYAMLKKTALANADLTALWRARIKGYGSAAVSQDKLLNEIKIERAKELFMEGFRLSDLKRWGDGFTRTPQVGTIDGALNNSLHIAPTNSLFTWPIPKHEMDAGNGIITPNPSNNK